MVSTCIYASTGIFSVITKSFFLRFGGKTNNFWQYDQHSFKKVAKFVKIRHLVYFNIRLITKFRAHKRLFRALGTMIFKKTGHLLISQNATGNTALYSILTEEEIAGSCAETILEPKQNNVKLSTTSIGH